MICIADRSYGCRQSWCGLIELNTYCDAPHFVSVSLQMSEVLVRILMPTSLTCFLKVRALSSVTPKHIGFGSASRRLSSICGGW